MHINSVWHIEFVLLTWFHTQLLRVALCISLSSLFFLPQNTILAENLCILPIYFSLFLFLSWKEFYKKSNFCHLFTTVFLELRTMLETDQAISI